MQEIANELNQVQAIHAKLMFEMRLLNIKLTLPPNKLQATLPKSIGKTFEINAKAKEIQRIEIRIRALRLELALAKD
jgi:hypothetical protein